MSGQNLNGLSEESSEYSFAEIYYVIKKHSKLIVTTAVLIFFLATYYTLISKPLYASEGVVMISEDQRSMSLLDIGLNQNRNHIENEMEVLKSRTTVYEVIKYLFNSEFKNDLHLLNTKTYEPNKYRQFLTFGLLDKFQDKNDLEQELTTTMNDYLLSKFSDNLIKSMSVQNKRNTDIITIKVTSLSPKESQLIVNTIIDIYKRRDLEWITGEMSHLKTFLINQLEKKEVELNLVENNFKNFQQEEKIFGLDKNAELVLENLTLFESQYNNVLAAIDIANEKSIFLNNQLTEDEIYFSEEVSNSINARLLAMKNELSRLESERIVTISKYGEIHSAVQVLDSKIIQLKQKIEKETNELILKGISVADPLIYRQSIMDSVIHLKSYISGLKSKANSYKKLVDEYDKKLSYLPNKLLEYTKLERVRNINAATYKYMSEKLEEAKIGEASKIGKIRVIDYASLDTRPVYPNKKINIIIGLLLGLGMGALIAFVIEYFDNTVKSVEQIERRGMSILAMIPDLQKADSISKRKKQSPNNGQIQNLIRRLITSEDPKSPISEAYRTLRTSLMYNSKTEDSHIILVSSSGPGEGKTTTVANLAITYANLGKKTVLIDVDLRKPVVNKIFDIKKSPGITEYLSSSADIEQIAHSTDIANLDVISSGVTPPNPSELLESDKMLELIKDLRKKYDLILFDSPPLIAVTDAFVLLKYVDQFLLVVRAGKTEKGALNRVCTAVNDSQYSITGVVLNAISQEFSYGAGYYYNYYQYYYGEK